MEVLVKVNGELANNTYFIKEGDKCIIVDPGQDTERLDNFVMENKMVPVAIILTHGHWDHYWGIKYFCDKYKIRVYMHKRDHWMLEKPFSQIHNVHLPIDTRVQFSFLEEGMVNIQGFDIKIIHTPGHSQGGVCIYLENECQLISGDTLFKDTVGRWDFEGGSEFELKNSIRNKLYVLPENTVVRPGHGFKTTIGHEIKYNDSVKGK